MDQKIKVPSQTRKQNMNQIFLNNHAMNVKKHR